MIFKDTLRRKLRREHAEGDNSNIAKSNKEEEDQKQNSESNEAEDDRTNQIKHELLEEEIESSVG